MCTWSLSLSCRPATLLNIASFVAFRNTWAHTHYLFKICIYKILKMLARSHFDSSASDKRLNKQDRNKFRFRISFQWWVVNCKNIWNAAKVLEREENLFAGVWDVVWLCVQEAQQLPVFTLWWVPLRFSPRWSVGLTTSLLFYPSVPFSSLSSHSHVLLSLASLSVLTVLQPIVDFLMKLFHSKRNRLNFLFMGHIQRRWLKLKSFVNFYVRKVLHMLLTVGQCSRKTRAV